MIIKKAFDTLLIGQKCGQILLLSGRILDVIKHMYLKAKACVAINRGQSECFHCQIGARQGENLSLLMFLIYLVDLNNVEC